MLRTARWVTGSALRDLVLFGLVWVWLSQLLIPFGEATKIPSMQPFLLYLGVLYAIDWLVGHWAARITLKLALLATMIFTMYYFQYGFTDLTWLKHWGTDLYFTAGLAMDGKVPFDTLYESVRTTVFLIALWFLQSFFRHLLGKRVWMFVFLLVGVTGLGVLDTFYVESAKWEVVLFLLFGLILLAFMQLPQIERTARMQHRFKGWPTEWLVWTLVLSLVLVGTAWATPKKEDPSWPDPVAFLKGKLNDGPGRQKIGYGSDDAHLGGPFEMDETEVFRVWTNGEGYFRGETKTYYTGQGWLSNDLGMPISDLSNLKPYQQFDDTTLETKKVTQTITLTENVAPVIFSQYRMTKVEGVQTNNGSARYSPLDQRLDVDTLDSGMTYKVTSEIPVLDTQMLNSASTPAPSMDLSPYLSLPASLPDRVKQLAQEITKDAKTPYERAEALEKYLQLNYTYDTEHVPVPAEGQDFVDQFLFESKIGYCDHFSSSMVVMARTLGMPARWVKGFTQGDVDLAADPPEGAPDDTYLYIVSNKNAHSWPEIYFEGVGWVQFEPTTNFHMPREFKKDETVLAPIPNVTKKHDNSQQDKETKKTVASFEIDWKAIGIDAAWLAAIALILAVIFRRRLLIWWYLRVAYKGDGDIATNAITRLFHVMGKLGWRRSQDMTLREYALYLSGNAGLRGREMIPLAKIVEGARYGKREIDSQDKLQIRDLWVRLVRKAGRYKEK
ncbi:MAG TPA: transglutaminase domain-containing protein [Bacilli bacterium]|nr:transglutaminase domain-containing protein [Bacilli bacterium]